MTGTSAREIARPARRMRPAVDGAAANAAPPVLFRLPPISSPMAHTSRNAGTAAMAGSTMAMPLDAATAPPQAMGQSSASGPGSVAPAPAQATSPSQANSPAQAAPAYSVATRARAAAIKLPVHWLNTLIVVLLLIALVVVSVLAFRKGPVKTELVDGQSDKSQDALASLADLQVPQMNSKALNTKPALGSSTGGAAEANLAPTESKAGEPAQSSDSTSANAAADSSESLISGLETRQLARPELAPRPAAQVQLGIPVPMLGSGSSSLVDSQSAASANSASALPTTTPRYETVSTPSASKSAPEKPQPGDSGASPTLYDGAQKASPPAEMPFGGDLVLSGPDDSPKNSPSANVESTSSSGPGSSGPASGGSANLGVTVGGGLAHPTNLGQDSGAVKSTATPEMDAAAIGKKYLEHVQRKNAMLASSGPAARDAYAPANGQGANYQGTTPTASAPRSATLGSSSVGGSSLGGAALGASAPTGGVVPYGTTGTGMTPYVRNAPGAQPSGLSSGSSASATSVGYSTNMPASSNGGYNVPPRSPSYPSLDATMQGAPAYPAPNQPASGRTPTPTNSGPAASSMPGSGTAVFGTGGPTGVSPTGVTGMGSPGMGSSGMGSSGMGGGATYPRSSQTVAPGGQAPLGMIGQSGYATAPSGDFAGGAPTPVAGTIGFATSTVSGMPADARPTTNTMQGTGGIGAASPYNAAPQYR